MTFKNRHYHEYLGDGVYASFDGFHIWLDLRAQGAGDVEIGLEPSVFERLFLYRDNLTHKLAEENRKHLSPETSEGDTDDRD